MSAPLVALTLVLCWVAKQILGTLLGQQVRGSIPGYTAAQARRAARLLPRDLAQAYLEDWLAELATLDNKPLSALRYSKGLASAARDVAILAEAPVRYSRLRCAIDRFTDITVSVALVTILVPVLVAVAATARLPLRRVVEQRTRAGLGGRPFAELRFAMIHTGSSGAAGETWMARMLRQYGLVGLPLFLNVLRGEMAIVGPPSGPCKVIGHLTGSPSRPLTAPLPVLQSQSRSLDVLPGIASWETLVFAGLSDLPLSEARIRDRRRSVRRDTTILLHYARAFFSASGRS